MDDERKGTQAAQLLNEKGYENVFLLSGGIEDFVEDFPELCEGKSVPASKKKIQQGIDAKRQEKLDQKKEAKVMEAKMAATGGIKMEKRSLPPKSRK